MTARDMCRAPLAAVGPEVTIEDVAPAAAGDVVVAETAVDHVGGLVPDQDVCERRAFEALEAIQAVMAVAFCLVGPKGGRDPAPTAFAAHRGGERGEVPASRSAVHAVIPVVAVDKVPVAGPAAERVNSEAATGLVFISG